MTTLIEKFILVAPRMEVEETPAPGTEPDEEFRDPGEDLGDGDDIDDAPDDRPHVGPFEFPQADPEEGGDN